MKYCYLFLLSGLVWSCNSSAEVVSTENLLSTDLSNDDSLTVEAPLFCNATVEVGAQQFSNYIDLLKDKKVGIVGNQSTTIGEVHLVDSLIALGVNVVKVFSPEHGFRGTANAGEKVVDGVDNLTGLPIISLYGNNKKPKADQLTDIDVLVFDIQDVGARFYTYISTLNYVMEAAAENGKKVIVLDRPNPNGHYVDGPVLDLKYSSFVGMNKVPVVHGMTIGEYAQMLNGEKWLKNGVTCDLTVVPCLGWDHTKFYELPIAPSPNLPNMTAVYLYPSLCFFEGTIVSIGRGTPFPFQCVGHPDFEVDVLEDLYRFKPEPTAAAKDPKLNGETCFGYSYAEKDVKDLRAEAELDISILIEFYTKLNKADFFLENNFINLLAGTDELKEQIKAGKSAEEIKESWKNGLVEFKELRLKYLLYPDFE